MDNLRIYFEGADIPVVTNSGKVTKRIYLNSAATGLALKPVLAEVNAGIPLLTYINAPGPMGERNTIKYENVREIITGFVGGDSKRDTVIYVKNSTEGMNVFSELLYQEDPDQIILTTAMEHMANYLPYKLRFKTDTVGITPSGDLDLNELEHKLVQYGKKVKVVAVTGASNVTGIMPPIYKIAKLVHKHGAKLFVDVVQLIQHRPFTMRPHTDEEHIDFIAFSAHKCYTPFDGGALVGPKEFFQKYKPDVDGAGAASFVSTEKIVFSDVPARFEAGYPDLFGVTAMGTALVFLEKIGLDRIAAYEKNLMDYCYQRLKKILGIKIYGRSSENDNVPFLAFNIEGRYCTGVANALAYEHGIETAAGTVGADIYTAEIQGIGPGEAYQLYRAGKSPGVVRISLGIYNTFTEIDCLANALESM